jgi:hypothetical protein
MGKNDDDDRKYDDNPLELWFHGYCLWDNPLELVGIRDSPIFEENRMVLDNSSIVNPWVKESRRKTSKETTGLDSCWGNYASHWMMVLLV